MMYAGGPNEHAVGPAEHLPMQKELTELTSLSRALPKVAPPLMPAPTPPGLQHVLPALASARAHQVRGDLLAGRAPAMHGAAHMPTHTTIQPPPVMKRDPLQRAIDRLRAILAGRTS